MGLNYREYGNIHPSQSPTLIPPHSVEIFTSKGNLGWLNAEENFITTTPLKQALKFA